METFTDLLDTYLLALGAFNHYHSAQQQDPLRFAQDYREASAQLLKAKAELNSFFEMPVELET
jgi:hypothetical protein